MQARKLANRQADRQADTAAEKPTIDRQAASPSHGPGKRPTAYAELMRESIPATH